MLPIVIGSTVVILLLIAFGIYVYIFRSKLKKVNKVLPRYETEGAHNTTENQPDSNWYYAHNNRQNGPVELQDLRRLITAGTLTSTSLVWHSSLPGWTPVSDAIGSESMARRTRSVVSPRNSQLPPPPPENSTTTSLQIGDVAGRTGDAPSRTGQMQDAVEEMHGDAATQPSVLQERIPLPDSQDVNGDDATQTTVAQELQCESSKMFVASPSEDSMSFRSISS